MVNRFIKLVLFYGCIITTQSLHAQFIYNVTIIDGTGAAPFKGSIRIKKDKIIAIGNIKAASDEQVIDGKGLVLTPGFIDSHSHHFSSLQQDPKGVPNASQGVTTIVIGQDGEGEMMDTLQSILSKQPVAINVASYTGHSSLRERVMGEKNVLRKATPMEIEQMRSLLLKDLNNGSLGLSTGLEYEQAFYSAKEEVMDLAKLTATQRGRYISHIRSEDVTIEDAMNEIIDIGRETKMPVQVAHIKIGMQSKWGKSIYFIDQLNKARAEGINITADVYPYNFWNSTLRVLFPARDYSNLESAEFAVKELFDPTASVLVQYAPMPSYKGKTLAAVAKERNETPAQTLIYLVALAADFKKNNPNFKGTVEAIAAKGMSDQDVANFIAWPYANICSDGNTAGHPRGYGSFTKVLGKYVREEKLLTLTEAVHKMTGLSAEHLGLKKRGIIAVGNYADLVLLNPETVIDNATIDNSKALSTGIEMVWVNGQLIYKDQKATGHIPGVLIKRDADL